MYKQAHPTFLSQVELNSQLFANSVGTAFDDAPDVAQINDAAFRTVHRALQLIEKDRSDVLPRLESGEVMGVRPRSEGVLVLGGPGTGKTHLLSRVARAFAGRHLMVFVKRPVDEEYVIVRIWHQLLDSLCHRVPGSNRRQLDLLLANVLSHVVVTELQREIQDQNEIGRDKKRIIQRLTEDPFEVFKLPSSQKQLSRKAFNYIERSFRNDLNSDIVQALLKYVFYKKETSREAILAWLRGQQIPDGAENLRLPDSWLAVDEEASPSARRERRSELAFQAIQTIGFLSTTYHPLVLAFDQLESLRDKTALSQCWGNVAADIISYAPNFVVVTCMLPKTWADWFVPLFEQKGLESYTERINGREAELDPAASKITPEIGREIVARRIAAYASGLDLPSDIYPFEEGDIKACCEGSVSLRVFIKRIRKRFEDWLDNLDTIVQTPSQTAAHTIDQSVDQSVDETEIAFKPDDETSSKVTEPPLAESQRSSQHERVLAELRERFARSFKGQACSGPAPTESAHEAMALIVEFMLREAGIETKRSREGKLGLGFDAICFRPTGDLSPLCLSVTSHSSTALYRELGWIKKGMSAVDNNLACVLARGADCSPPGQSSLELLYDLVENGLQFIQLTNTERQILDGFDKVIREVESSDFVIDDGVIVDKQTMFDALRLSGILFHSQCICGIVQAALWSAPAFGDFSKTDSRVAERIVQRMIRATLARQRRAEEDPSVLPGASLGTLDEPSLNLANKTKIRAKFIDIPRHAKKALRHHAKKAKRSHAKKSQGNCENNKCRVRLAGKTIQAEVADHTKSSNSVVVNIWQSSVKELSGKVGADQIREMKIVDEYELTRLLYCLYNLLGRGRPMLEGLFHPAGGKFDPEKDLLQSAAMACRDLELQDEMADRIQQLLSRQVSFLLDQGNPDVRRELTAHLLLILLLDRRRILIAFDDASDITAQMFCLGKSLADNAGRLTKIGILGDDAYEILQPIRKSDLPFHFIVKNTELPEAAVVVTSMTDLIDKTSPANSSRRDVGDMDFVLIEAGKGASVLYAAVAASMATTGVIVAGQHTPPPAGKEIDPEQLTDEQWFGRTVFDLSGLTAKDPRLVSLPGVQPAASQKLASTS